MSFTKGIDVSHWSPVDAIEKNPDAMFCIAKASEGKSMKDEKCGHFLARALAAGMAIGMYHYAHPELNTAEEEANNFLAATRGYPGAVLVLDWEGKSLSCNPKWALEFMRKVEVITGVKPMLYVQNSAVAKMKAVAAEDYGLWVARWGRTQPSKGAWPFWALWQYEAGSVDKDYFNGSIEQFKKYGEKNV